MSVTAARNIEEFQTSHPLESTSSFSSSIRPINPLEPDAFAEAVQDIKVVKSQALSNAKAALEEAFGKKYNEMFRGSKNIVPQKSTNFQQVESPIESTDEEMIDALVKELENECDVPEEITGELRKQISTATPEDKAATREILTNMKDEYVTGDKKEEVKVDKRHAETVKMIQTFRDKVANYPKHLSYEGSMVLCVMLSLKDIAHPSLSNLPMVDQEIIRKLVPNKFLGDLDYFSVSFDNEKDFKMKFSCRTEVEPYHLTMFNSVAHPRPEDLKDMGAGVVPVEKDGDRIAVGGKILLNKKGIKKLIGVEPLKRDATKRQEPEEDACHSRRQPVSGRNAYEIRADVLQMALDWAMRNDDDSSDEDVVDLAKKFYQFVENKR